MRLASRGGTSTTRLARNEVLQASIVWTACGPAGARIEVNGAKNGSQKSPLPGPLVELTGFEPVTPSLRKMWANSSDQEKRHVIGGLWGGCGASDVRLRES